MKAFDDLKSQWDNQSQPETPKNGPQQIMKKMATIRGKQRIMNVVLLITALILVAFFFYVSAYNSRMVVIGLGLMIGALAIRIALEIMSINKINKMDVTIDAARFKATLITYYRQRRIVHLMATPLIIIAYCIGFIILLPSFKSSLSSGFYNYILVSSVVVLIVLGIFIIIQIRKELSALRALTNEN